MELTPLESIKLFSQKISFLGKLDKQDFLEDLASTPHLVLGHRKRARLLQYRTSQPIKHNIFIVPSLINHYYVLDLFPGCSLIEELLDLGFNVTLLDWQNPRPQDRFASLEEHIFDLIDWGFDLSLENSFNEKKWSILGHCIGGTFSIVNQCYHQRKDVSFINLVTPIDFDNNSILSFWSKKVPLNLNLMVKQWGQIHHEFLQLSFRLMEPMDNIQKYKSLWKKANDRIFLKKYYAIDHWIKDRMDFPGKTYQEFIEKFFKENNLIRGILELKGQEIQLHRMNQPVLIVTASGDHIVEENSAKALCGRVEGFVDELELPGGHIGCLLSQKSRSLLTQKIEEFIEVQYAH